MSEIIQVTNERNIDLNDIDTILAILTYIEIVREFQKNIVGNFSSKSLIKTLIKRI